MASNISALCLMGAEKVVSASNFPPSASATEPILLAVSSANMRGSVVMFLVFRAILSRIFLESRIWA